MIKAPAIFLLSLALAGCAMAPQARLASDTPYATKRYAWDGAGGEDPNRPARTTQRSQSARNVAKSIPAPDATDAEQDAQLSQSLVICKGCLRSPPPSEDARLAKAAD